ncbi:MAG: hypothetical protein WBJ45_08000 [Limnohabitans sp.]|uniref:hypothetical protein n=1 Tax=Limnohabitans sp. TaxID=1907725 RepID=UPI003BB061D2
MASITLRSAVGRPLTNSEVDANFSALNLELGQKLVASLNLLDLPNPAQARSNLGLGNVENKSSATIRGELTSGNVTGALGYTPLSTAGGTLTGQLRAPGMALSGFAVGATGGNLELGFDGTQTVVQGYNRTSLAYIPIWLESSSLRIGINGSSKVAIDGNVLNSLVAIQQSGNQVLHAGNYTNYSPSLTGSGAAGVWPIAITGRIVSNDTRSTALNPSDLSAGVAFDFKTNSTDGLTDAGGQGYHGVMSWRSYSSGTDMSGGYPMQLAYGDSKKLYARFGTGNSTWSAWQTFLDSSNYSSYALPLSGGVLSGAIRVIGARLGVSDNNSFDRGYLEWSGGTNGVVLMNTDNSPLQLGTNGVLDRIKIDYLGRVTMAYQPYVWVRFSMTTTAGQWQKITGSVVVSGSNWDAANNRFNCPVAGKYMVIAGGYSPTAGSGSERYALGVALNGTRQQFGGGQLASGDTPISISTFVLNVSANDFFEIHMYTANSMTFYNTSDHSFFAQVIYLG